MGSAKEVMRVSMKKEVDESYNIIFGNGLFDKIASDLKAKPIGAKYAIITDNNVVELAKSLSENLKKEGLKSDVFVLKAGEENKTMDSCMKVMNEMSAKEYVRDSAVIAVGGGVVGDMAGFIAAIFNRGIPYVQVPTTFLAQVDASIGGKTGVDTDYGKNLIGVIKQPYCVYVDIGLLKTLPDKHIKNGLAETIKHAVICDAGFFKYLGENVDKVLSKDTRILMEVVKKNCEIKASVIEKDAHESGIRKILNYGHTIGHAIEKVSDFKVSHGEGVAIGMMVAGRIAVELGGFSEGDLALQEELLIKAGLPVCVPADLKVDDIIEATLHDKKARNGKAMYVLPLSIGKVNSFNGDWASYVNEKVVRKAVGESYP